MWRARWRYGSSLIAEGHVQGAQRGGDSAGEGMQRHASDERQRHAEGITRAEPRIHFGGIEVDHALPEGEPGAGTRCFRGRSHRIRIRGYGMVFTDWM